MKRSLKLMNSAPRSARFHAALCALLVAGAASTPAVAIDDGGDSFCNATALQALDSIPGDRALSPAELALATTLAQQPGCAGALPAELLLVQDAGWHLALAGHGCSVLDSQKLRDFKDRVARVKEGHGPRATGDVDMFVGPLEKEVFVLERKFWTITSDNEAAFQETVQQLHDYGAVPGTPARVCLRGATYCAQESLVFAHFIWGHFFPTFVAVARLGHLHRSTRLTFNAKPFMCPRSSLLAFYGLFFDYLPSYSEDCHGATVEIDLDPVVPIISHYGEDALTSVNYERESWERHLSHCQWRPVLQRAISQRFAVGNVPSARIRALYLRRGLLGAVGRVGETEAKRNLLNDAEVSSALRQLEDYGAEVVETTLDVAWHEQVRQVLGASVMLGLHGSALGSHELWMPTGSVLVSVQAPGICECRWPYCAVANKARALLYVLAVTPDADCQLGGSWLEQGQQGAFVAPELHSPRRVRDWVAKVNGNEAWDFTRRYDPSALIEGLRTALLGPSGQHLADRFLQWALAQGHQHACARMALRMVDGPGLVPFTPSLAPGTRVSDVERAEATRCEVSFFSANGMGRVQFALIGAEEPVRDCSPTSTHRVPVLVKIALQLRDNSDIWVQLAKRVLSEDQHVLLCLPVECAQLSTKAINMGLYLALVMLNCAVPSWQGVCSSPPAQKLIMGDVGLGWFAVDGLTGTLDVVLNGIPTAHKILGKVQEGVLNMADTLSQLRHDVGRRVRACSAQPARTRMCAQGYQALDEMWRLEEDWDNPLSSFMPSGESMLAPLSLRAIRQPMGSLPGFSSDADMEGYIDSLRLARDLCVHNARKLHNYVTDQLRLPPPRTGAASHLQSSGVEEMFPNATRDGDSGAPIDIFRMRHVCVRDLSSATPYTVTPTSSVPHGHRLELLTFGLAPDQAARVMPQSGSRFIATHLPQTASVGDRFQGADFMAGLSLFWYDGHSPSTQCIDCSHLDHHFQDDSVPDWVAYYYRGRGTVARVVRNNLASVGYSGPKRWFTALAKAVAHGIAPLEHMHPDETLCFEEVIINFQINGSKCQACTMYTPDSLFPGYQHGPVLAWVRGLVWAAHGRETPCGHCIWAYGRQSGMAQEKRRAWVNMQKAVELTGATVLDFVKLPSFRDEVRIMMGTSLFLTVVGGHLPAALFMRPGSIWVELGCWESVELQWGSGRRLVLEALGIRYVQLEAKHCRKPIWPHACAWLPVERHPLVEFARQRPADAVLCHGHRLCVFRPTAAPPLTSQGSPPSPHEEREPPLERLADLPSTVARASRGCHLDPGQAPRNASLLRQMRRCMEWDGDCSSIDPDRGELYRGPGRGAWDKAVCTSISQESPEGVPHACLRTYQWTLDRSVVDGDVDATEGALEEMRRLASEVQCPACHEALTEPESG